jgi:hypothetical protein
MTCSTIYCLYDTPMDLWIVCKYVCMSIYIYIYMLCCLQEDQQVDINLAPVYSSNYPVIFNIFLWFGVVFAFSLLAISSEFYS